MPLLNSAIGILVFDHECRYQKTDSTGRHRGERWAWNGQKGQLTRVRSRMASRYKLGLTVFSDRLIGLGHRARPYARACEGIGFKIPNSRFENRKTLLRPRLISHLESRICCLESIVSQALQLDFCPFKEFVMGRLSWQERTTLLGAWVAVHPMAPQQGGHHVDSTRVRPARPLLVRPGLLPSHLPTLPRPAPRRRPDHRPPHRLQPAPHRRRLGPRRRLQLSPRPLQTALVHSRLGADPGPLHPRSLGPRGARLPGRRRYRRRAPRRQGLWQGLSPRPGALDPFLHRLPLGAQMGRPGDPGPVPLRHPGLGAAGLDGVVSQPGEGHESDDPGHASAGARRPRTRPRSRPRSGLAARPGPGPRPRPRRKRPRRSRGGGTRPPRN